ncbi:Phosphatidylinositol N-acetylglucosaminyltransferase GPI2 subunit [Phlyctema vagabunda]|uniref:Phosphatidylinositol N-acetylglucosaminyltransferase GPI2 subunit n=1 Tax=Phlyctema vagabunda TaxID=108571 RepID=A0ABR4PAE4_9HELO
MVPIQAPQPSPKHAHPYGTLKRSTTLPVPQRSDLSTRNLLAPEDAIIYQDSPPRKQSAAVNRLQQDLRMTNGVVPGGGAASRNRGRSRNKSRNRSSSRKATWKKLLWVKQSYPDNYTDQDTFLEHLQRNPRLQPYDFWPLVADSTVIVQHVCSVIIFIVCFVGISEKRLEPIAVVTWGSVATVLGWVMWDWWVGQETAMPTRIRIPPNIPSETKIGDASAASSVSNLTSTLRDNGQNGSLLGLNLSYGGRQSHSASLTSIHSTLSQGNTGTSTPIPQPAYFPDPHALSPRTSLRISTAKSALLIYFTLLGLSPILKSLTMSTSPDSIWAMSFLLFVINIFFFDYGSLAPPSSFSSSKNKNIPASLSTNAALMASTVLASRLPSTGQVFSLTLFSIEVFGLFPVFRRYAQQRSWRGHLVLTAALVAGAGGGVGLTVGEGLWPWKSGLLGVVIGIVATGLAMGGCSWWLIGLQKYKNEIHGPWDPARPIIRRQWDD